jgi:hypothetical protein
MNSQAQGRPPTVWIVLTAVFALAAIGLGIWAFTTKSDLDDANATIDQQEQQLASERRKAGQQEASEKAFGERAEAAYRRVRRRLLRARGEESNLRGTVEKEAKEYKQAQDDVAAADSQDEKEAAQLKAAREKTDVAGACARGTVDAINEFFGAVSARAGADRAMRELEKIQGRCQSAVQ